MVSFLLLGAFCAADGFDGLFQPSDESMDYFRLGKSRVNVFGKGGATAAWGAGLILIKFLLALATGSRYGLNPITVRVTAGESRPPLQDEYLVLMVTTLNRLFLGMKPFWSNNSGPLRFTSLRVPYRYLWRVLPALLRGNSHPLATANHGYISENLSEIRLGFDSGFVLDGEVYPSSNHEEPLILDSPGVLSFVRLCPE